MKHFENQEQNTYQTGSTTPPKSYQGIIAVLLILVIFLGGIVGILSMMNIRLFRLLEQKEKNSVAFSKVEEHTPALALELDSLELSGEDFGFSCQEITGLYRSYQQLPGGLYISQVTPDSPAQKADLRQGDILLKINGRLVEDMAAFETAIRQSKTCTVTIYREQQELTVTLQLPE